MKNSENKLVIVVMGQNVEKYIKMCLDSVKDTDKILFCDGGSTDRTLDIIKRYPEVELIVNKYDQDDLGMNGKQRNFYLNYLKKVCPNWWALCLDADEVVEDLDKIKELINKSPEAIYSIKMRHLIGDLSHEDATQEKHYVLNRLFKVSCVEEYPEVEHPVLQAKKGVKVLGTDCTTIWHLAYVPNMWAIKKRYDNHVKKSNMHTPEYLKGWYYSHLFGTFPTKQFNPAELPVQLLKNFGIEKDELYFANRGIEVKHSMMVKQWAAYFRPKSILDLGCGRGPYLFYWSWLVENCLGIELSEWAVKNSFAPSKIRQGDISQLTIDSYDLVTAIDVLEHLDDDELDSTLKMMAKTGNKFLFSIPFAPNDPNLYNDSTHKQFRTRDEWIKLIESHNIKISNPPESWLFAPQLLIGNI